ncbi:MAG TPA: ABC transporter ATP-binding protein, partial [Pseudonocardiaceae bacterium]|nr:ABC transporter ATP-binding protein [Pseudonocardiaceae bacterium]
MSSRELRFAIDSLPRRPLLVLVAWSVPEALPASLSGIAVERAVDTGFLAGHPLLGVLWLSALVVSAAVGALGSRQVFRLLGRLVEPFRDELVRRVVGGALRHSLNGKPDDGALARLTHQVEIARDNYAGLIVVLRGFLVTVIGVVIGLSSIAPIIVLLMLPPFLLGFGAFVCTLGMASKRYRTSVKADEQAAIAAGAVLGGIRDVVASGAEAQALRMVAGPVAAQAAAERAIARVAVARSLCFAVGGWVPMIVLLVAGPWLVGRGFTAGDIMGGLTYVLIGLQPMLRNLIAAVGTSGLRFLVTLRRILDASEIMGETDETAPRARGTMAGYELAVRDMTFAYGPHAEPVLRSLDLTVAEGDHLAIVGPSGIGKSTLAGLLCGLLRPNAGTVEIGGVPTAGL